MAATVYEGKLAKPTMSIVASQHGLLVHRRLPAALERLCMTLYSKTAKVNFSFILFPFNLLLDKSFRKMMAFDVQSLFNS